MGTVKLNIWVSETDDPCKISNRLWYINIFNCDGTPLLWCDRAYIVLPAPCGHREIEVPPGCYRINAVWSYTRTFGLFSYRVNHYTDNAIVQACCGQEQCITLFNPSAHRCGTIFVRAIENLTRQGVVKKTDLNALKKIQAVIDKQVRDPEKTDPFDLTNMNEIQRKARPERRKPARRRRAR